jgi:sugar/nucleoside kinase (ribokinase family)
MTTRQSAGRRRYRPDMPETPRTEDAAGASAHLSGPSPDDHRADLDVVAIGSAIVDVLVEADDADLERLGLQRGTMLLVDRARADELDRLVAPLARSSGGSAANTAVGIAALGGRAGFIGATVGDVLGRLFRSDLAACGVRLGRLGERPAQVTEGRDGVATGRCVVFVTPDGERTMVTYLGAAATLTQEDLDEELVAAAQLVYLEGYLWDVPSARAAMRRAVEVAHQAGGVVALSASDPLCASRHRRAFRDLLVDQVDVLFANEEEAKALFGAGDIAAVLSAARDTGVLVVVTRGAAGATVVTGSGPVEVPAEETEVVDTTGAGDLFAAGFCYGLTHGADPDQCARLGAACAAEVVSHLGARPTGDLRRMVAAHL